MLNKRVFDGDDDDGFRVLVPEPKKKRPTLKNAIVDVMKGMSANEIAARIEPSIRKAVREEMERLILTLLHPNARPSFNQTQTSERRVLQLLFVGRLPSPIYTCGKVETEESEPLKIVLVDPISKTRVTTGPYSSLKIEILVIDGEFGSDDQENWTESEFNAKIVRERDGKRPLVTGDLYVTLTDGVGIIGDIYFTDNSSWMRCRKFRLGARVTQKICGEVRITEARSEAFVVKDHRGELYKKHYPPSLDDEVWRLEKIAKDGKFHKRLAFKEVHTVRDFLRMHTINPVSLCEILGASNKAWETIVEHANTCVVNNEKLYAFTGDAVGLLFNDINKLFAVTFDGQNYVSPNDLTFPQKLSVENQKKVAYRKVNEFVQIDARAIFGPSMPAANRQAETSSSPTSILLNPEYPIAHQEIQQLDYNRASSSTSYDQEEEDSHQFLNSLPMGEFFSAPSTSNGENNWSPYCSQGLMLPSNHLAAAEMSQLYMPTWSPGNGFFLDSSELGGVLSSLPNFSVHISRPGKPKAAWCKIRAAVILESFRRDVAARRTARPFFVNELLGSSI